MSLRVRRTAALAAVALLAPVAIGASACGAPQTIRTYTPAHGVNADQAGLKARNVVLIAKGQTALLSAAFVSTDADQLEEISGHALNPDGSQGAEVKATVSGVEMKPGQMTIVGGDPKVEVSSPDLRAGQTARLTFSFAKAGDITMTVPVMDQSQPDYTAWPKK